MLRAGKNGKLVAKRALRVAVVLAFFLVAIGCLGGCKFTSVLTQHIEDEQVGELDETANPIYRESPGAPEDSMRTSSTISDSDRIDEQTQTLPVFEQAASENGLTDIREQRNDSANDDNASTGQRFSYAEGENEMAGEGEAASESSVGEGEGVGEGASESRSSGEGEPGDMRNLAGGIGGQGETFDATGTDYELPEGVNSIAAAGQYAMIVQMLAGRGALVATDNDWITTVTKQHLFPGEGIEDLPRAWRGDADLGYSADIEAIMAADPDVVLVDNASVKLDDAQQARLQSAGIDVVVLPKLGSPDTPDSDVVKAVSIVGELLSDAETQFSASDMADDYGRQHDDVVEACLQANGGYSYKMEYGTSFPGIYQGTSDTGIETTNLSGNRYVTAYIDSWTTDVNASSIAIRRYGNVTLYRDGGTIDASEGAGLSAVGESRNFLLLAYYLQVAGVVDNSYEGVKPVSGGAGVAGKPYLVVPGGTRNLITDGTQVSSRTAPSALWFAPNSVALASSWLTVGDEGFPLLLVKSEDIAQRVVASANKVDGLYNVGSPYAVRVVPSGVNGSWADGTIESFLIAPWAEGLFKQDCDLERSRAYTEQFYKTFYRCSVEDACSNFDTAYAALCTVG